MSPLSISLIVFAFVLGGALLGLILHPHLPDDHLASDTKDVVRLAMALVATTVGLTLGLLIGSAKSFFDTQNAEVAQLAANTVLLDRLLAHFGPDASDARQQLRTAVSRFNRLTLGQNDGAEAPVGETRGEGMMEAIQALSPQTDSQRSMKNHASELAIQLDQTRWLMFEQRAVPVPTVLLGVLTF